MHHKVSIIIVRIVITVLLLTQYGNSFAQWVIALHEERPSGKYSYSAMASPDGHVIYVGGVVYKGDFETSFFFEKSTDEGLTWFNADASVLPEPHGINDSKLTCIVGRTNTIIAVGDSGLITTSHDGGTSFQLTNYGTKLWYLDADINETGVAVVAGNYGSIGISEDFGLTWSFKEFIGYTYFINCRVIGKDTIYLVGGNRSIYRSYDKGLTWDSVVFHPIRYNVKKGMTPHDVFFWNSQEGLIVGYNQDSIRPENNYNGIILKTTDGGSTWTTIFDEWISGGANGLRCIDFIDRNNGVIGGNGNIIMRTSDGGSSWWFDTIVTSKAFLRIKDDILLTKDNNILTHVLVDPAYSIVVRSDPNADVHKLTNLYSLSVSPNPVTSQATISFAANLPTLITIHDALGREVFHSTAYSKRFEYDCRALPPGVYFVKATSNAGITESCKFIKN